MFKFVKDSISDFIFCIGISVGLSINIFQAFYVPKSQSSNLILLIAFSSILLVGLFACSYNKKSVIISAIFFAAVVIASVAVIRSGNFISKPDFEINTYLFYIITATICVFVFLLSRTVTGTLILFLAGIGAFFIIIVLQYENYVSGFIAFLIGTACMFFHKSYKKTSLRTNDKNEAAALHFSAISLTACLIAVLLAFLSYSLLIKPINPTSKELTLLTKIQSLEIVKKAGLFSEIHLYNENLKTKNLSENKRTIQNDTKKEKDTLPQNTLKDDSTLTKDYIQPSVNDNNNKSQAVTYIEKDFTILIIASVILSLLLLIIAGKKLFRRQWYKNTLKSDRQTQILRLYKYYLDKFKVIGCGIKNSNTLFEFADRMDKQLKVFSSHGTDIHSLTDIYVKVNYGNLPVTDEDYKIFLNFHKPFYKNCRRKLGYFKYGLKFLLL